jgi:hypothetical protein
MRIFTLLTLVGGLAAGSLGFAATVSASPLAPGSSVAQAAATGSAREAYASFHRRRVVVRHVYRRPAVVVRRVYRPFPIVTYRPAPVYYGYRPVVRTVCRVRTRLVRVGGGYYVPRKVRTCTRRY